MKLFFVPTSPFARKVLIVAQEKNISLELEEVVLADANNPLPQYNPLGKIPTLVLDDGTALYDSSVIAEYLEHHTAAPVLIPREFNDRISVRRWEALADGVCDAIVLIVLEERKDSVLQDQARIAAQTNKVKRGLAQFNHDLVARTWCVGDTLSLADIALGCMVGYVLLRLADRLDIASAYPHLYRVYQALKARPACAKFLT